MEWLIPGLNITICLPRRSTRYKRNWKRNEKSANDKRVNPAKPGPGLIEIVNMEHNLFILRIAVPTASKLYVLVKVMKAFMIRKHSFML